MTKEEIGNKRIFIAAEVPPDIRRKINKFALSSLQQDQFVNEIKMVEEENIHITLKFIGNINSGKLTELKKIASEVSFTKFSIALKGVGVFPNEKYIRTVWIGCDSKELENLATELNEKSAHLVKKEEFKGHLTIARVKKKANLIDFIEKNRERFFGDFELDKFELKSSELTVKGLKYKTEAVFYAGG